MKTKIAFIAFVLAMALTLPTLAQNTPDSIPKSDMKQPDKMSMMGKPTFAVTSGDLLFNIWITTQEDHKKMMMDMNEKGMKDKGMKMDTATKEVMLSGTHHMMAEVKNTVSDKETNAISVKVEIVSPTNKNSSINLKCLWRITSEVGLHSMKRGNTSLQ